MSTNRGLVKKKKTAQCIFRPWNYFFLLRMMI